MTARTLLRSLCILPLLMALCGPGGRAQQVEPTRDELDTYLRRLVTEIRADITTLADYEPVVVLRVVHDERGYRVQASDLLERRLTDALAMQGIRVIDPLARERILDELEACYTDEAPFCQASDVVGRFQTAGSVLDGSVLPVRGGTELRVKLVVAAGAPDYTPGEILGTWSVVVPPPSLDPVADLAVAAGVVSYGRPPSDSVPPEGTGELRVDVRTQDGSQAWVQIDGRVVVPAPVTTTTTAGRHLLTVTASGHRPFTDYVNVAPRSMTTREIILERGVGSIDVTSNAPDAAIYLDGEFVGRTPWKGTDIESGPHVVRVEQAGFEPFISEFVLEHQEQEQVEAEMIEHPGDIVVTCMQDDLSVYLDDAGAVGDCSMGRPLTVHDVPPGSHRVWGERGEDRTAIVYAMVRGGEAVPVNLSLGAAVRGGARREPYQTASNVEYEPFGGPRFRTGLYVDVGFVIGQAKYQMDFFGTSAPYEVDGQGARLALGWFGGSWDVAVGTDYVFMDEFGFFSTVRYLEIFLAGTIHFLPRSSVRPFLGARGMISSFSFQDNVPGAVFTDMTSTAMGGGGQAGVELRLGRSAALQLGATYTVTGARDIEGKSDFGDEEVIGRIDDWRFVSGFATLSINIGPR